MRRGWGDVGYNMPEEDSMFQSSAHRSLFISSSFLQIFANQEDYGSGRSAKDKKPIFGDDRIERLRRWVSRDLANLDMWCKVHCLHCGGSIYNNVELWCLCCMMMFRWPNKQPGIQKFWTLIDPFWCLWLNITTEQTGRLTIIILTQESIWGEISRIIFVICLCLLLWSTLWCFWGAIFSGLHFFTFSKTLIVCM